jgi:hypothetical protein
VRTLTDVDGRHPASGLRSTRGGGLDDVLRLHVVDTGPEALRVLALIAEALPGVDAREVGSTAVPGVIGKGDLDLLVRVPADTFSATRAALDLLFPRNPDQLSNERYQGYLVPSEVGRPMDEYRAAKARFVEDVVSAGKPASRAR